jgi:hypothetical protein
MDTGHASGSFRLFGLSTIAGNVIEQKLKLCAVDIRVYI